MTDERSEATCPADVLEAIPWYPDGLGEAQRGALEAHAAHCAECRRELAFVQDEPAEEPAPAPDAERVWARVLERMTAEAGAQRPRAVPRRAAPRRWLGAAAAPLPLAASIVLALAVGALGVAVGSGLRGQSQPVYETASAPREGAAAGPELDLVFRKDASAGEIEAALRGIDGRIVSGPSPLGVFRVALHPDADAAAAAAALRAEVDGVASLAEPVRP